MGIWCISGVLNASNPSTFLCPPFQRVRHSFVALVPTESSCSGILNKVINTVEYSFTYVIVFVSRIGHPH